MSLCFPTKISQAARKDSPSARSDVDMNVKTKKTNQASNDESNENLDVDSDTDSSSIYVNESDSSHDAPARSSCPPTVSQIVNTLSAAGTFGGLALIITGGMGMTLSKPIDNTVENIAMVLSGGALLVGSLVGNVIYANRELA